MASDWKPTEHQAFDPQLWLGVTEAEGKEICRDWPQTVAAWNKICRDGGACEGVCQCLATLIEATKNDRRAAGR